MPLKGSRATAPPKRAGTNQLCAASPRRAIGRARFQDIRLRAPVSRRFCNACWDGFLDKRKNLASSPCRNLIRGGASWTQFQTRHSRSIKADCSNLTRTTCEVHHDYFGQNFHCSCGCRHPWSRSLRDCATRAGALRDHRTGRPCLRFSGAYGCYWKRQRVLKSETVAARGTTVRMNSVFAASRPKHCQNLIRANSPLSHFQMGYSPAIHAKSRNLVSTIIVVAERNFAGNTPNRR